MLKPIKRKSKIRHFHVLYKCPPWRSCTPSLWNKTTAEEVRPAPQFAIFSISSKSSASSFSIFLSVGEENKKQKQILNSVDFLG